MRLAKTDLIVGLTATDARALMREMGQRNTTIEAASAVLGTSIAETEAVVEKLAEEGFVKQSRYADEGRAEWITTIKGNALAQAAFTKPIKRVKAEGLLQAVLERASAYNADPTRLLSITEIRVFGSYTKPEVTELGDLDLAVRYAQRNRETFYEDLQRQAHEESSPGSIAAEILYPLKNMLTRLKQRSPFIKITTENIELFTDSWQVVYKIESDPVAIDLTDTHIVVRQD